MLEYTSLPAPISFAFVWFYRASIFTPKAKDELQPKLHRFIITTNTEITVYLLLVGCIISVPVKWWDWLPEARHQLLGKLIVTAWIATFCGPCGSAGQASAAGTVQTCLCQSVRARWTQQSSTPSSKSDLLRSQQVLIQLWLIAPMMPGELDSSTRYILKRNDQYSPWHCEPDEDTVMSTRSHMMQTYITSF